MTRITIEIPPGESSDALLRFAHNYGKRRGAEVRCHLTISAAPAVAGEILKAFQRVGLKLPMYFSNTDHEHRPA